MADFTYFSSGALDALLTYVSGTATELRLLDDYERTHNWATVDSNTLCTVTPDGFTGPTTVNTYDRRMQCDGGSGTASADSTLADLHVALTTATAVVLVTPELTKQPITQNNPVTFPAFYYEVRQPATA